MKSVQANEVPALYVWQSARRDWHIALGRETRWPIDYALTRKHGGHEIRHGETRVYGSGRWVHAFRTVEQARAAASEKFNVANPEGIPARVYAYRCKPITPRLPFMAISYASEISKCNENNSCTVIALAAATGMPYARAHELCAAKGRKPRQGFHLGRLIGEYWAAPVELEGHRFTRLQVEAPDGGRSGRYRRVTLGQFVKANPVGTFIVTRPGHAFVIYDGMVCDHTAYTARTSITKAWMVEKIPA